MLYSTFSEQKQTAAFCGLNQPQLEDAKARVQVLGMRSPGEYLLLPRHGE
jgi:hypothetical protein